MFLFFIFRKNAEFFSKKIPNPTYRGPNEGDKFSGKSRKYGFRARESERLIVGARNFCGVFLRTKGRFLIFRFFFSSSIFVTISNNCSFNVIYKFYTFSSFIFDENNFAFLKYLIISCHLDPSKFFS